MGSLFNESPRGRKCAVAVGKKVYTPPAGGPWQKLPPEFEWGREVIKEVTEAPTLQDAVVVAGVRPTNLLHEQMKVIKYNNSVANLVLLHNVESMTLTLQDLKDFGHHIDHEILKGLAPYRTDHINRVGDYTLDFERQVSPMSYNAKII